MADRCAALDPRLPCSTSAAKAKKGYTRAQVVEMLKICGLPARKNESVDTLCHRLADHLQSVYGKCGFPAHMCKKPGPNAKPHRPPAKKSAKPKRSPGAVFDASRPCGSRARGPDAYRADEVVDVAHEYGIATRVGAADRSIDAICDDLRAMARGIAPAHALTATELACRNAEDSACIAIRLGGRMRHYDVLKLEEYIRRHPQNPRDPDDGVPFTKSQVARIRKMAREVGGVRSVSGASGANGTNGANGTSASSGARAGSAGPRRAAPVSVDYPPELPDDPMTAVTFYLASGDRASASQAARSTGGEIRKTLEARFPHLFSDAPLDDDGDAAADDEEDGDPFAFLLGEDDEDDGYGDDVE